MHNKILNIIHKNRISSTEVADALGKKGAIPKIRALNTGHFISGTAHYVCTWDESNWPLHEQIQNIPEDSIVYVDAINCEGKAIFGDLVAKSLLLYSGAKGIVVNGLLRDIHRLKKENYPIWCTGVSPIGCFNKDVPMREEIREYQKKQQQKFNGAVLIADDSGCVIIEKAEQEKDLIEKLEFIELQEDIWYFCIDTLKLSTYETICQKTYLKNPNILPDGLKIKMEQHIKDQL